MVVVGGGVNAATNLLRGSLWPNGVSHITTDAMGVTMSPMFHYNEPAPAPWHRRNKQTGKRKETKSKRAKVEINVPICDVVK